MSIHALRSSKLQIVRFSDPTASRSRPCPRGCMLVARKLIPHGSLIASNSALSPIVMILAAIAELAWPLVSEGFTLKAKQMIWRPLLVVFSWIFFAGPSGSSVRPLDVCEVILQGQSFDRMQISIRGVLKRTDEDSGVFNFVMATHQCGVAANGLDGIEIVIPDNPTDLRRALKWMLVADQAAKTRVGQERGVCATLGGDLTSQFQVAPGMPHPHHGTGSKLWLRSMREIRACDSGPSSQSRQFASGFQTKSPYIVP
jgi:hypothetical protein